MTRLIRLLTAPLALSLALAACGGGGGGGSGGGIGGTGSAYGTLRMSMTDAPACGFDAVNITVEKIRVHQGASAADADGGWSEIVVNPPKRVDLLTLQNGALVELGQTQLPPGKYTQLRLVLAENGSGAAALTNSVVPTGGSETPLTTPSATESGLKLNADIDVAADQVADYVLDFDACKSIVKRGNSGQYNLKPVIRVIPRVSDAGMRLVGQLDPLLAGGATSVSVQANGVPVKATAPDATGQFVLYPVPAGTYDLVVTAPGRVTAVMTGVPVTTTAYTAVNAPGSPILPPASAMRSVSGTVAPATATARALQALTGGPTVEIGWGAVDGTSGAFSFSLPIAAPVRTAYAAGVTAPVFTADATAAARYTLEANSAGALKTQAIDVGAAVPATSFTFP